MTAQIVLRTFVATALTVCAVTPLFAADHEIVQLNRTFSETEITVKLGDNIVFKNDDEVTHNVFSSTPNHEFDLRRQAPGASSTVLFDKEGDVEVQCSIHPKMKLLVHVRR